MVESSCLSCSLQIIQFMQYSMLSAQERKKAGKEGGIKWKARKQETIFQLPLPFFLFQNEIFVMTNSEMQLFYQFYYYYYYYFAFFGLSQYPQEVGKEANLCPGLWMHSQNLSSGNCQVLVNMKTQAATVMITWFSWRSVSDCLSEYKTPSSGREAVAVCKRGRLSL